MDFPNRLISVQNCLRPFFRQLTKDLFLAEETLQFASVQCWQRWTDKDETELKRLMMTVGRRYYLNHCEKEKNEKNRLTRIGPIFNFAPPPESDLEKTELREQVRQSLERLPAHWREVLHRVFFLDQSNDEVARAMGQCQSTIKTWRLRALKRLYTILGDSFLN